MYSCLPVTRLIYPDLTFPGNMVLRKLLCSVSDLEHWNVTQDKSTMDLQSQGWTLSLIYFDCSWRCWRRNSPQKASKFVLSNNDGHLLLFTVRQIFPSKQCSPLWWSRPLVEYVNKIIITFSVPHQVIKKISGFCPGQRCTWWNELLTEIQILWDLLLFLRACKMGLICQAFGWGGEYRIPPGLSLLVAAFYVAIP